MKRSAIIIVAAALIAATPQPDDPGAPRAHATALLFTSDVVGMDVVRAGDAHARAGEEPVARGRSAVIGGEAQQVARATQEQPDDETVLYTYDDPTGTFSFEAGFAQARVSSVSSSASAGFSTGTGSSFAMADELFTYEQQEMMLGTWADLMDAIFTPANDGLALLDPVLEVAGLERSTLEGISPEGLIDLGAAEAVAAHAATSSSPGFSSARAEAVIGHLTMFGGFIQADDIVVEAVSESVPGASDRHATATIGRLAVAGLEVVGDGTGLALADNDLLERGTIQPAFDLLLDALATAGITIEVFDDGGAGDARHATALGVSVVADAGEMTFQIGHAEASAPDAQPVIERAPAAAGPDLIPPATVERSIVTTAAGPAVAEDTVFAPPTEATVPGAVFRRPTGAAAQALAGAYAVALIGALAIAVVVPLWIRRARAATTEGAIP